MYDRVHHLYEEPRLTPCRHSRSQWSSTGESTTSNRRSGFDYDALRSQGAGIQWCSSVWLFHWFQCGSIRMASGAECSRSRKAWISSSTSIWWKSACIAVFRGTLNLYDGDCYVLISLPAQVIIRWHHACTFSCLDFRHLREWGTHARESRTCFHTIKKGLTLNSFHRFFGRPRGLFSYVIQEIRHPN